MLYSIFCFMYWAIALLTGIYITIQTFIQLMICAAYDETCNLKYAIGYYHWFCKYFAISLTTCTLEEALPLIFIVMPLASITWPIAIPLFVIVKLRMYSTLPNIAVSIIKYIFKPYKEN